MAKKAKNDYPSGARTSWKVVLTYLFVLALCAALFYYIFNQRNTIHNQRANIDAQHQGKPTVCRKALSSPSAAQTRRCVTATD